MLNMLPREHHHTFTHRLLPGLLFNRPDRVLADLTGPMGGTFLFFHWQELGKEVAEPLRHTGPGTLPGTDQPMQLLTLDVLGIARTDDKVLVPIRLPPTKFPGEAMFVAAAHDGARPRYFTFERTIGVASLGEPPDSAYLGEIMPDGSRVSHGLRAGTDATAFAEALCPLLGLDYRRAAEALNAGAPTPAGMPHPGTADMFGPPRGMGGAGEGKVGRTGQVLSILILAMLVVSVPLPLHGLRNLLALGTGVVMLVWLYRLFDQLQGRAGYTPGMAVAWWFIPGANLVMPALVLRNAWKVVCGREGQIRPIVWWVLHLGATAMNLFWLLVPAENHGDPAYDLVYHHGPELLWGSFFLRIGAYGLLLHIVRTISRRA